MAEKRDDFTEQTKRYLALRASHRCSFTGCQKATVGPSEESSFAVASIGVAAHICAAAPLGKRFDPRMTGEHRSAIENGIWLCSDHATLIDRDDARYTVLVLCDMKRTHEARCAEAVRRGSGDSPIGDLVAIGPEVIAVGGLVSVKQTDWSFHVTHFVRGDLNALIDFIETFEVLSADDRYILINEIGDGRVLSGSPSFVRNETTFNVTCPVDAAFPRILAQELGGDLALSDDPDGGDLVIQANGDLAVVSGLDALPQKLRLCLSTQKGDYTFAPSFGNRLAEYYVAFNGSPWLARLLALEVIRQASIPVNDLGRRYTALQCVERVWAIEIIEDRELSNGLSIRADMQVKGVGRWQSHIFIGLDR